MEIYRVTPYLVSSEGFLFFANLRSTSKLNVAHSLPFNSWITAIEAWKDAINGGFKRKCSLRPYRYSLSAFHRVYYRDFICDWLDVETYFSSLPKELECFRRAQIDRHNIKPLGLSARFPPFIYLFFFNLCLQSLTGLWKQESRTGMKFSPRANIVFDSLKWYGGAGVGQETSSRMEKSFSQLTFIYISSHDNRVMCF